MLVRKESMGFTPGKQYYTKPTLLPDTALVTIERSCRTCLSTLLTCSAHNLPDLELEYISLMITANNTISVSRVFCSHNPSHKLCSVRSQQQFLFKFYFSYVRRPDIILVFTTFTHEFRETFLHVSHAIEHFINVLDESSPDNTSIVWFTTTPFSRRKLKPALRDLRFEKGYNASEKVDALNHLLFDILRFRIVSGVRPRMFGFFDLLHMAREVDYRVKTWARDHVHFKPKWYKYVMRYLIHMMAADMDD